jgi:uncharacterized membrane protein
MHGSCHGTARAEGAPETFRFWTHKREVEPEMARSENETILMTAAALGAISGMRSMAAPALLTHELAERGSHLDGSTLGRLLSSESTSRVLSLFAGGEMLADKMSFVPDRTSALPLVGRAVIGSLTAAAYAVHRRRSVVLPAAIGAAAAIASTFAAFHIRRFAAERFHIPDRLLGMAEDAVVVAASKGVIAALDDA